MCQDSMTEEVQHSEVSPPSYLPGVFPQQIHYLNIEMQRLHKEVYHSYL